ncbi:hypothetical protein TH61_05145 [Rufibacter sp. DG15C]|uniref:hypothetical protein n=1 Tax=Rufibacter sp. DG15C TaxID=1379909 RepID=UPI00078BB72C|nr:hypothetical protein [Rufibacter sp. DG15C]AMM50685.1 hypothetical protein TH61_05145 [Rufibacter sp. DG15C]
MTISLLLLLVFAVLLGTWLTWLAVRRADRRRLAWRIVASWVAVACLVLLVSPPSITRTYSATEAILLTEGYRPDTLTSLLNRLSPKPKVFSYDVKADRATLVTDFSQFKASNPAVQTVHVLGHGLEEETLAELGNLQVIPHLAPLPTGVLSASWPHKITLGEDVQVQGKFISTGQATRLYLQAAGIKRDSVEIKKGAEQMFRLRFQPKTTGRFVYHLQWRDAEDSLRQEQIPVIVEAPRLLNVLLLSSAPSFEVKFLKNALAQKGHGVAVRSQVSKGIYQTETVNLPAVQVSRVTPALLQKFDVMLLDAAALQSMSGQEKQAVQQAVRQQGLGVLTTFTGDRPKSIPFFGEAAFARISEKEAVNGPVRWQGQTSSAVVLPLTAFAIRPTQGQQPLAWSNRQNQALVLTSRKGVGQVGVSLVPETFSLALEGKEKLYQDFWATVLTGLAKPLEESAISVEPLFATVHQSAALTTSGEGQLQKPVISTEKTGSSSSVLSAGSTVLPSQLTFTIWPQKQGWHSFQSAPGLSANFFIYPSTSWQTHRLYHLQQSNLNLASAPKHAIDKKHIEQKEAFPLWPFGLGLLLALGFLWLEEKV